MKLEDQVVSLELAKKLKELGVEQDSYAYWYEFTHATELKIVRVRDYKKQPVFSAFTVAELFELLPNQLFREKAGNNRPLSVLKPLTGHTDYYAEYYDLNKTGDNLADVLGEMLIYLLENKLI